MLLACCCGAQEVANAARVCRSATLCDAIVASDKATFHTPFQALGLCPEGCSSVHFAKLMGDEHARRMLDEGWKPTAQEAKDAGMVDVIVEGSTKADDGSHPQLRAAAHELAQVLMLE